MPRFANVVGRGEDGARAYEEAGQDVYRLDNRNREAEHEARAAAYQNWEQQIQQSKIDREFAADRAKAANKLKYEAQAKEALPELYSIKPSDRDAEARHAEWGRKNFELFHNIPDSWEEYKDLQARIAAHKEHLATTAALKPERQERAQSMKDRDESRKTQEANKAALDAQWKEAGPKLMAVNPDAEDAREQYLKLGSDYPTLFSSDHQGATVFGAKLKYAEALAAKAKKTDTGISEWDRAMIDASPSATYGYKDKGGNFVPTKAGAAKSTVAEDTGEQPFAHITIRHPGTGMPTDMTMPRGDYEKMIQDAGARKKAAVAQPKAGAAPVNPIIESATNPAPIARGTATTSGEMDTSGSTNGTAQPTADNPPIPKTPDVGYVRNGYRFKGGNPQAKESWERVQ